MISLSEAVHIHSILIDQFGGMDGIRSEGMLMSALLRPYQIFDDQELYPTAAKKAAAIMGVY